MTEFGFKKSEIIGDEKIFSVGFETKIPEEYSYRKYMPEILNQGQNPICVPCSISAYLNWKENLKDGSNKDNGVKYFDIYDSKTTPGDGMTFKEAFHYVRHNGVDSKEGLLKINAYALINNFELLKYAIISNGPCVGALPVYNYYSKFWKQNYGENILGYHAISIVGYDKEGFIIRNSWSTQFGDGGYTKIPYNECMNFIELWTIVE